MLGTLKQIDKKAIAYYRHSAEDKQENSVAIQRQYTEKFARDNNIKIIHEEADEGKSGLLASRPGFERLFTDWIENSNALPFDYVLVYDVSRWGRFQDQDQAAYYTHLCTKYGKEVVYVSRGFPDTNNPLISSLETSLQRYMAAEYSRQLSEKVFYGCIKVSEQGYSAGGMAVYGMARQLLDVNKKPIRILNTGEHKQIANERVSFTPKDDKTTETVKAIFNLFVNEQYEIPDIVECLNKQNVLSANNKLWDKSKVIKILSNETYVGTRIYNKTWGRLKQKSHRNPRSQWVIVPNAFKATVNEQIFKDAQERLYWMFPSNYRKGINAIKHARKLVRNDIFQWLLNMGLLHFETYEVLSELPIIFCVKHEDKDASPLYCFLITEKNRRFDNILAISVVPDAKKMIDDFFLLSTRDFTISNYLVLSKNNHLYNTSKIEGNRIEETIKLLIHQLKNSCKQYNSKYPTI
jgi:DNA invertase Pin-like site-specific DNA recombinase